MAIEADTTVLSLTNGEGVTITADKQHEDKDPVGTAVAHFTVVGRDGTTIGFNLSKANRRRLRALIDMMDI